MRAITSTSLLMLESRQQAQSWSDRAASTVDRKVSCDSSHVTEYASERATSTELRRFKWVTGADVATFSG